jgi:D-alanyl-D-alanine endopeptidase (penicillin-binding protein 7)
MIRIAVAVAAVLALSTTHASAAGKKSAKHHKKGVRAAPTALKDGGPGVLSAAAVIFDLDTGEELYVKDPDAVRMIASTTKLFVALVVRDKKVPLDGETTITKEDRKYSHGGARSRLLEGRSFKNQDLLRAMLIGSDNRAATAIGRGAGMSTDDLIAAMNAKAKAMGLTHTQFTDPSGIHGNVSTAREMAIALRGALADPVIAETMRTKLYVVTSTDKKHMQIQYMNTNRLLRSRPECIGGKTGYNDEARYCLAVAGKLKGRRVGMIFLGAEGQLTRFADYERVAKWLDAGGLEKYRAAHANDPAPTPTTDTNATSTGGAGVGHLADPPPPAVTPRLSR